MPVSFLQDNLPGLGDFLKNSVVVFILAYIYTPAISRSHGAPPAPNLRFWTKIKWPVKWINWLERNGSAMYFFLYESEKLVCECGKGLPHAFSTALYMCGLASSSTLYVCGLAFSRALYVCELAFSRALCVCGLAFSRALYLFGLAFSRAL